MLWQVFSESVSSPLKGVATGKSMLAKINFPRESLLLAGMYETAFNTLIKIGLLIMIFAFYLYLPPVTALFSLVGLIALMILGNTIGILLTPIGMLYTDIQRGIGVVLQFAIYLTPVIYPEPKSGTTTRNFLLGTEAPQVSTFIAISIIALVLYIIGLFFYRLAMPIVIERVGS